ncbi:SpoIIE family protein phosphatase [Streptomyces sp. NPDC057253]|uniref:ATP-binding SpoIIE family protein phosphatase n=1 Tax=Streptomyces sp. NPDC057253 TaxID=3346069 RepID=UPI003643695A
MTEDAQGPGSLPPGPLAAARDLVAVAFAAADGRVTHWSAEARTLWGWPPEEALGLGLSDLFTAEAVSRHQGGRSPARAAEIRALVVDGRPVGFLLMGEAGATVDGTDSGDLLSWLYDQFPAAVGITDNEARILRNNRVMCRLTGREESEVRGLLITEAVPDASTEEDVRRVRRVAATGEAETTERFVRAPGEENAHAWVSDFFPLKDSAGVVRAVAVAAYDYSRQYGTRERLALMSEARTRIGRSLDVSGTAAEVVEVAVPRFADAVSVHLLEAVFQGDLPAPLLPGSVVALRSAVDPAPGSAGDRRPPPIGKLDPVSPLARCLCGDRAELLRVDSSEIAHWFGSDPQAAGSLDPGDPRSLIAVPVRARGVTLGLALFLRRGTAREPFSEGDLIVTEDLIARAAICLDNARRFTREHGIAEALQRTLLPQASTRHPAVETMARYVPAGAGADVGGDWFDVIPLPGARVGLVVGDVVGHGITASATMGQLRTAVRTLADIELPPDELLTHLDDVVTHAGNEADADGGSSAGATCLYAVYDPVTRVCTLAAAGHPPPVLVRPDGTAEIVDLAVGPPLGLGSLPFEATELLLPEGSVLALFTDGLIESREQDVDSRLDELRAALERPGRSLAALCDAALDTLHARPTTDDVALLVARTRSLDRDHVAEWELDSDPAVVAGTRRMVDEQLGAWGLEEAAFTTELVVSELVTNAIRYGSGPIRLRLIRDRALICEVADGSATAPHLRRARLSDEGGRGLFLVARLTERWGTRYTPTGKIIWAEQALEAS